MNNLFLSCTVLGKRNYEQVDPCDSSSPTSKKSLLGGDEDGQDADVCNSSPVTPLDLTGATEELDSPYQISVPGEEGPTSSHRLAQLTALVMRCSHRELVHLQEAIQPLLKRDFLTQLPLEVGYKILNYLSPPDLLTCAQVNRRWREISEDNLLWRSKWAEMGMVNLDRPSDAARPVAPAGNQWNETSPALSDDSCSPPAPATPKPDPQNDVTWKQRFIRHRQIECNWRRGTVQPPLILKGHDNHVITCLEFYQDKVISASDDSTIGIWCIRTGALLRTLEDHQSGVWALLVLQPGGLLVSGSTDKTARVWDLEGGRCMHTLAGHASTVRCLDGWGWRVVSGSRDATLRVWDVTTAACLSVLKGHRGAVRCVKFRGERIASGSYDYTVRVWDATTGACLQCLSDHLNRVYTLLFDGERVISGSLDTTIRVWDAASGRLLHTFYGHQSLTSEMELDKASRVLVSSNADETIRVWDVNRGSCLNILAGEHKHLSAVTSVHLTDKFIISSSDDGTVKLWDLATGNFLRNLVQLDSSGCGGVIWRMVITPTHLICAAGSRNGAESTHLVIHNFDQNDEDIPHSCQRQAGEQQPGRQQKYS